jgi:hypothetical protein
VPARAGRHAVCAIGEDARGATVFASAADGAFARAVDRALAELVTAVERLHAFPEAPAPADLDAAWAVDDPAPIRAAWLDPAMRPALDFFLDGPPLGAPPPDAAGDLVAALVTEGLRPLYVDCSDPDAAPFRAGKVILVGALPHSFATGRLRLAGAPFAPPRRVRAPPPPGWRPPPGETTPWPFPLA